MTAHTQGDSLFMRKLDQWQLPIASNYNDVWGYVDGTGREYAILGQQDSVFVFDVTTTPMVKVGAVAGGLRSSWRDMKTYGNYLYAVSDAVPEGLIIIDLSNLPTSITKIYQSTTDFSQAHNIYIDEDNARLYVVGSYLNTTMTSFNLLIYDLSTSPASPPAPTIVKFNDVVNDPGPNFYIHDIYVRDNIAYASHGSTGYYIWDLNDLNDIKLLGSYTYVVSGYNHSSWVSDDGTFAMFAEETVGFPLTIIDITDLSLITSVSTYKQPLLAPTFTNNIAHNPFIKGDYAYVSYYEDGVVVIDISNPASPFQAAYYDTNPLNTFYSGTRNCWGVYPFLPSGKILASDIKNGLFVLEVDFNIVLPVVWESFDVIKAGNKAHIEWKVSTKDENVIYSIEKSNDALNYGPIVTIEQTTKSEKDQSFKYEDVLEVGQNYYRIKSENANGEIEYSAIKHIEYTFEADRFRVLQNPVFGHEIRLNIELNDRSKLAIVVNDTQGRQIGNRLEKSLPSGNSVVEIPLAASLTPGLYILSIDKEGYPIYQEKIIVQN